MVTAKRLSGQERKAMIIEAATNLFSEKGFHGVSIDDIVKQVGISPALLYQHFKSKDALYQAVRHQSACRNEDYFDVLSQADDDLEDVLYNITRIFVDNIARQPSALKMELHSLLDGADENHDFFENHWKNFYDFIAYMIEEKTGDDNPATVDPRVAGLMFQGMIRELLFAKCLETNDRFSDKTTDQLVNELVSMFLTALNLPRKQR